LTAGFSFLGASASVSVSSTYSTSVANMFQTTLTSTTSISVCACNPCPLCVRHSLLLTRVLLPMLFHLPLPGQESVALQSGVYWQWEMDFTWANCAKATYLGPISDAAITNNMAINPCCLPGWFIDQA
jgi:hypothetical protein